MLLKLNIDYSDPKTGKKYKAGDIADLSLDVAEKMIKYDMAKVQKRVVNPSNNRGKK